MMFPPIAPTSQPWPRNFCLLVAVSAGPVVFIGFTPSFYLKGALGPARELSGLAIVHGIVMTAWFVLFVVQAALISQQRPPVHRRLGMAGAILAPAMFVLAMETTWVALADEHAHKGILAILGGHARRLWSIFHFGWSGAPLAQAAGDSQAGAC